MQKYTLASPEPAPLRFAIVGCGLIGRKRLDALPPGSVVATCDQVEQSAAELAARAGSQCRAVTGIDQALATEPDAVIIAAFNASLAPLAAVCIRAGKDVLVEKPVAISVAEIDQLRTLAHEHGVIVRAGYNHRYHPAIRKARQIFESGALGQLMFIRGRYGHGGRPGYDREWRADPQLSGGGELIDQGVHLIDLANWFVDESWASIHGHTATYFWDMPVDDNAFISLRSLSGATAWLHVSCTEWKNLFSFEIYGQKAKLHIEGLGGSYGVERLHYYQLLPAMGPPETVIYEFPGADDSWAIETREFVTDIRRRRTPSPGLRDASTTLKVVETVYRTSALITAARTAELSFDLVRS
jgi:predicted dehydrogenase